MTPKRRTLNLSVIFSVYKKVFFLQKRTVLAVVERLFWQLVTHFTD